VFGVLLLLAAPAVAQIAYSDDKLDAFVRAAIAVEALLDQWIPRIEGAGSEAEADRLRGEATQALFKAIERTEGISLAEYEEINEVSRSDPDLTARIAKLYRARTGE
jgi:hypothetical protein